MIKNDIKKMDNQFLVKSNVITRAVRSSNATIMKMRLFVFGLSKLSDKQYQVKKDFIEYNISIAEFDKYYEIGLNQLYDFVKVKGRKTTLIKKEMDIISSFKLEISFLD